MLKILRTVTMSPEQYDIVFCDGMRNPKNSWDRSDSYITHIIDKETEETADFEFFLGENDEKLATNLAIGGPVHAKYRRMMPIWVTINAPLYWWKEFETYKVGTVCNSCSTMHKIHAKEFTLDDFSHEYLTDVYALNNAQNPLDVLEHTITTLNWHRKIFLEEKSIEAWRQLIQLLPSSYNQTRTVMLNYEVISQMDYWRENHKLTEWHTFCDWIKKQKYYIPLIRPDKMPKKEGISVSCPNPEFPTIGGKLCIRTDLKPGRYGCASFYENMKNIVGKGLTVKKYVYDGSSFGMSNFVLLKSDKVIRDLDLVGYEMEEIPYLISKEMIMEM